MLSFFRTKSGETAVDRIISGTEALSIEHIEAADGKLDVMASTTVDRKQTDANQQDALLQSLGYQNATDLKECIYGEWARLVCWLM